MGYWREMYGTRSPDFIKGVLAAIDAYSIWKDGKQWIGSPEKDAREEMKEVKKDLAEDSKVIESLRDWL